MTSGKTAVPIAQDGFSKFLTYTSSSELLFIATFGGEILLISLLAVAIMYVGLNNQRLFFRGQIPERPINEVRGRNYFAYAAVGIMSFFMLTRFVPVLPSYARQFLQSPTFSTVPLQTQFVVGQLFVLLIAVSEEQFFRGFWANVFTQKLGRFAGVLFSGVFFGGYHVAVYGGNIFPNIVIVSGAGMILTHICLQTGSLTPALLGHVINNAFASGLFGTISNMSIVGVILTQPMVPAVLIAIPVSLMIRRWRPIRIV